MWIKQLHQKNVSFVTIVFLNMLDKFEEHVCNRCHDLSTMAHSLKNIVIVSPKGATFRCLLMGTSKNEALKKLNNSVTYDWGVL